jgi:hypothetical protein
MSGVVRKEYRDIDTFRRKTMRRHREKAAIYKPRKEASEEINSIIVLTSDF